VRIYLSVLLICISALFVSAQNKYAVSGKVVNVAKTPIAFANVAIFELPDSTMIQGGMTDDQGNFILPDIISGDYFLKILYIGFETKEIPIIHLKDSDVLIPIIQLKRKTTQLNEITVISEKGMFETEAGKMIYNVENNINAVGVTASELLQNIPSVSVDMDEKVTIRGTKATIMIDGVESDLSTMIDQIPADAIESIEVITNPSVRYEAQNGGSIINIKLKQHAQTGYNGKVEAGIGSMNQTNLNSVLGYNVKNWRFSGMANYQYKEIKTVQNSIRTIMNSNTKDELYQISNDKKMPSSFFSSIKAGYFFHDKSFVDLKYIHQNKKQASQTEIKNENFKEEVLGLVSEVHNNNESGVTFNQVSGTFRKFLGSDNQKLEGNFLYSFNTPENEADQLNQSISDQDEDIIEKYRIDNKSYLSQIRLLKGGLDYTGKLSRTLNIETGTLFSINNFTQDFWNTRLNYDWNTTEEQYDLAADTLAKIFSNNTFSGSFYGLLSGKWGRFHFSGGLRFEYLKNRIESDSIVTTNTIKIVPSIHLQKAVSEKYSWEISMTTRTIPPKYNQLNPISLSWGNYNKSSGNPKLTPEFIYQLEFDNTWKWNKSNLNMNLFFKNETQIIGQWYYLEEEENRQVSHSIYENLGNIYSLGVDASSMINLKNIIIRTSAITYYNEINGDKFASSLDRREISYIFKMNSSYPLNKKISMQLTATYHSPQISVYGKQFGYYQVDLGLRSKILKNKGSLVLKAMDIFNTVEYEKVINQRVNYFKKTFYDPPNFLVYLSFSYKFNSLTNSKSSPGKSSRKS